MTESEWEASQHPVEMMEHLLYSVREEPTLGGITSQSRHPPLISDRKRCLFACAWWRSVLPHDKYHEAKVVTIEEVGKWTSDNGATDTYETLIADCFRMVQLEPSLLLTGAQFLRCIAGNPFRPVTVCATGTPQKLLAHLLDVAKTDSLGGMAVYDAGKERTLSDTKLSDLAGALQKASDEERNLESYFGRRGLTLIHWHTGNGHLSSSFQIMDIDCEPGEPKAWQIHLKNTVAEAVIRRVTGDLLTPIWLTPAVLAIADRAYSERDFAALPILADALEDASCTNEVILSHLRGPGPHARGCHVLDLLLGRS